MSEPASSAVQLATILHDIAKRASQLAKDHSDAIAKGQGGRAHTIRRCRQMLDELLVPYKMTMKLLSIPPPDSIAEFVGGQSMGSRKSGASIRRRRKGLAGVPTGEHKRTWLPELNEPPPNPHMPRDDE